MPETITNAKILEHLNIKNLENAISNLIKDNSERKRLQTLSLNNFYLTHSFVAKMIDDYRDEKLQIFNFNTPKNKQSLRILHINKF